LQLREYGCGHAQCRVTCVGDEAVFNGFDFDVTDEGSKKEFRFAIGNYEAVCKEIAERARRYRERTKPEA
jgi:hypothetical protein